MESVAQADRLKAVALEFACKHGLSALSARSLAGEVGGSPSAVNYYFGHQIAVYFLFMLHTLQFIAYVGIAGWSRSSVANQI